MEKDKWSRHYIPSGGRAGADSGGGDGKGIDLRLAGELFDRGRIRDAAIQLLAVARARIDAHGVGADVDEMVWRAVLRTRAADPGGPFAGEETIATGNALAVVSERYLSAYRREFVRLQGEQKIHGAGSYFRARKLQGQLLWRDSLLLTAGKVTVVHAVLRFIRSTRADRFKKRERAVAEELSMETNGFKDEETVRAAAKRAVLRVMTEFDGEVAASLELLQKAMLGAIRKAEEEAGHED